MSGKRCPEKTRISSELRALRTVSKMRAKGRTERRAYFCKHCRSWHLTGQPLRWYADEWIEGLA